MGSVDLVCVSCGKVDCGNGVWSAIDNQSSGQQKNSLCPECCRQRFPQFYSDFKRPVKRKPAVGGMLSTLSNFIKT